ncbi:MAG: sodium:solute symporter family protein [Saccharofermentanales bacterium]
MGIKLFILALFFIVMVGVGIYSKRKVVSVNDFVLGGRNVGPWLTAFAYGTSYFSAVLFIGYAGRFGWNFGVSAVWIGLGNAILGSLLAWLVLGKKTRRMTHFFDSKTMPDFFEKRYSSRSLKIAAALIIFVFLVPYSASVYTGLGYLFEKALGIPFIWCMIGMAALTATYVVLGGYLATAINDFIQGIIMLAGVVLMVVYIVQNPIVGGLSEGIDKLSKFVDKDGVNLGLATPFGNNIVNLIGLVILTSFGVWGLPQMIHKFYSIKSEKMIFKGAIISTIFALLIGGIAYFVGSFGRLYLNNTIPTIAGKANYDLIMPQILDVALPNALMGIVIILVLSASMSTLAALVMVSSSTLTLDLIKDIFVPKMDKKIQVLTIRILCVIFVIASVIVANMKGAIVNMMSISWGTIAGAFLAPFLYGLYWKGVTKAGVWAGFATGLIVTLLSAFSAYPDSIVKYVNLNSPPNAGAAAMLLGLIIVPLVSLITPKLSRDHLTPIFDRMKSKEEIF